MPDSGLDFSAKSDETALAEFQLLQPLTEGLSLEMSPALLSGK